jgi:hypothetical protein
MIRFSIRDVLWLTVVVGLAVGWWMDRRAVIRLRLECEGLRSERDYSRESETKHLTALYRLHPARQPTTAEPNP